MSNKIALEMITEAQKYAQNNGLVYKQMSQYHHRVQHVHTLQFVDFWTSGKYQNKHRQVYTCASLSEFVVSLQELTESEPNAIVATTTTDMKPHRNKHRVPVTKPTKFYIKKWMADNDR